MNEIEKKFFKAISEYLKNKNICINNKVYNLEKYDFGYQLDSDQISSVIIFNFEAHPEKDYFSGYIPDFVIYMNGLTRGFVIEIDGHEWHEKTKEQVKADKEKDRMYLKNGFIPVRFTGSEVYHNVNNCIRELFEIIVSDSCFFEYDYMNNLYEDERKIANHFVKENEKLSERIYQLCYGKTARKAIFVSDEKIELTPNITETA